MTTPARPQRPIPTVPVHPALLQEGDMIYPAPDATPAANEVPDGHRTPFRVSSVTRDDLGWLIFLDGGFLLYLPFDAKVETERRPNPGPPTPPEVWDAKMEGYPAVRYG